MRSSLLSAIEPVIHGFFGCQGGISQGDFATLNGGMWVGDDPAAVAENRKRMLRALSASQFELCTLHQVHSARVKLVAADASVPADCVEADALVTCDAGLMLGIATADCAPVLFAATGSGIIAAAHAGWRGALAGVLPNTLAAMCRLGVSDPAAVHAAIGPMIQQPSFEVGGEVRAAFIAKQADWEIFFTPSLRTGFFLFDLSALLQAQLEALHVTVDRSAVDSYQAHNDYFSHRYASRQRQAASGRQLALIGHRSQI